MFELACGSLTLHLFRSIFILSPPAVRSSCVDVRLLAAGKALVEISIQIQHTRKLPAEETVLLNGARFEAALNGIFLFSNLGIGTKREKNDVKFGRIGN